MRAPFVIRIESDDDIFAQRALARMKAALADRDADATIETARSDRASFAVGVRARDGAPKWLASLDVSDEPERAVDVSLSFLERWGFVPRPQRRAA